MGTTVHNPLFIGQCDDVVHQPADLGRDAARLPERHLLWRAAGLAGILPRHRLAYRGWQAGQAGLVQGLAGCGDLLARPGRNAGENGRGRRNAVEAGGEFEQAGNGRQVGHRRQKRNQDGIRHSGQNGQGAERAAGRIADHPFQRAAGQFGLLGIPDYRGGAMPRLPDPGRGERLAGGMRVRPQMTKIPEPPGRGCLRVEIMQMGPVPAGQCDSERGGQSGLAGSAFRRRDRHDVHVGLPAASSSASIWSSGILFNWSCVLQFTIACLSFVNSAYVRLCSEWPFAYLRGMI